MTQHLPNSGDASMVVTTTGRYARDLAERVAATFVVAAAGVAAAAGPADMFSASFWETVGTAGLVAAGSLVKGLVAKYVGRAGTASVAPRV
ncbi:hypothetical protein [Streptomyces sp. NPDC054784]